MNLDVKNVKISLKVWFFHHRKKKCFPALNAEQKNLKKYCPYLQAESQIVHHVPQLPVLRAVPVIKRVFISGETCGYWKTTCLETVRKYSDARRARTEPRYVFVMRFAALFAAQRSRWAFRTSIFSFYRQGTFLIMISPSLREYAPGQQFLLLYCENLHNTL